MKRSITQKSKIFIQVCQLCSSDHSVLQNTYLSQNKDKIRELFSAEETNEVIQFRSQVLESLLQENKEGFFVTDLIQLQDLISQICILIHNGDNNYNKYLKEIISLSLIPFRKNKNCDDRRHYPSVGSYFTSLCNVFTISDLSLQLETARAIYWFSQNCSPNNVLKTSSYIHFFPECDEIALYAFLPGLLHVSDVIDAFSDSFVHLLETKSNEGIYFDALTLCVKSFYEFAKRGQADKISNNIIQIFITYITTPQEFIGDSDNQIHQEWTPPCNPRVLAHCLLFIDTTIQNSSAAIEFCASFQIVSTLWGFYVEHLFNAFKKVQKKVRNEILDILILIFDHDISFSHIEKTLIQKMFDLSQSISILQPDSTTVISYSTKTRKIRLTHDDVDIELLLLSQHFAISLFHAVELPPARADFIEYQLQILKGEQHKYLIDHQTEFFYQALRLLYCFVSDYDHFSKVGGCEVILSLMRTSPGSMTLFLLLTLILKLHQLFHNVIFVKQLIQLPRRDERILSLIISILAKVLKDDKEMIDTFIRSEGQDLLLRWISSTSAEVVVSAVDCLRSISPFVYSNIEQRLVFQLLDHADNASPLLRFSFIGLFLDLLDFRPFFDAALQWKSLKTNSNIQRSIVKWWKEEEERKEIHYDHGIIIDLDKPLQGHPLSSKSTKKNNENCTWLLDKNSLSPNSKPYKLDLHSRLYLLLAPFPPLSDYDSNHSDRIKEQMIRSYKDLKSGSVWIELKEQLAEEKLKPLHNDKVKIQHKLGKMRQLGLTIQEEQCQISEQAEAVKLQKEKKTYKQLGEGLKTAQYVAENYKSILNSQPLTIPRTIQGRTVRGEDIAVRVGNLRSQATSLLKPSKNYYLKDIENVDQNENKLAEEEYIKDCLKDDSITYLVDLMKTNSDK